MPSYEGKQMYIYPCECLALNNSNSLDCVLVGKLFKLASYFPGQRAHPHNFAFATEVSLSLVQ